MLPYSQHKFSDTHQYENINYDDYLYLGEELSKYNDENFQLYLEQIQLRVGLVKMKIDIVMFSHPSMWGYIMADGSVYTAAPICWMRDLN